MSSVMFNIMFAAFATVEKESCSSFGADSIWGGVSSGMVYCEELKAPATLDKGKWGSRRRELDFEGVRCEFGEEGDKVTDRKPLEGDKGRWCWMLFFLMESFLSMPFLCSMMPALVSGWVDHLIKFNSFAVCAFEPFWTVQREGWWTRLTYCESLIFKAYWWGTGWSCRVFCHDSLLLLRRLGAAVFSLFRDCFFRLGDWCARFGLLSNGEPFFILSVSLCNPIWQGALLHWWTHDWSGMEPILLFCLPYNDS